jgi:arsenate reductase (thioredoxin)
MYRILLMCRDNSILSPLAEAYFKKYAGHFSEIYSAGVIVKAVDPIVAAILKEDRLDLYKSSQYEMDDLQHVDFDYVLTFDEESEAESQHLPSKPVKYHYFLNTMIPDSREKNDEKEAYRKLRDKIKNTVRAFIKDHFPPIDSE